MARLNGSTPVVLLVSVVAVFATIIGMQEKRLRDVEVEQLAAAKCIAVMQTDLGYIKATLDEIKVMLKTGAR